MVFLDIRIALKTRKLILDGGLGTELFQRGITGDTELANLNNASVVLEIHKSYVKAGADILTANTFGAYSHKHDNYKELINVAISNAKKACEELEKMEKAEEAATPLCGGLGAAPPPSDGNCESNFLAKEEKVWVALDMGPTGLVLEPYGEVSSDDCYAIFEASAKAGKEAGADLIIIETMMDLNELELAVRAAKTTGLPIFASMSFTEKGRTMYGASVKDMVTSLESLGVDAIGLNCGFGPESYTTLVSELLQATNLPTLLQPNAGIPIAGGSGLKYDVSPESFGRLMKKMADNGVQILGGCCGTEPAHITIVAQLVKGVKK